MACIAEGCLLGQGLDLYLCDTQLLAEEHLYSVKAILENGIFEQYYPAMSRPKIQKGGQTAKYTQDTIITDCGWALTARGMNANVRGGRVGFLRFTLVIGDDIDSLNDSLMVVEKKKRIMSRTVFPAMSKDGLFITAQNLITSHSFATQVYTRKTDILSERTVICGEPVKAFQKLELEQVFETDGTPKWTIKNCLPTWEYFDVEDARAFLARSGKEAFLAEYQHEFDEKKGKVIPNHSEEAQVITWSMFEKVFGSRCIPQHWQAEAAVDIGYSDGQAPHYSAWNFIATAAQNSPLPGKLFLYRSRSFVGTSIDDQVLDIWRDMLPQPEIGKIHSEYYCPFSRYDNLKRLPLSESLLKNQEFGGQIKRWQISHEKTGEMMTLIEKYGLPFEKIKYYKATDGVPQWNNLSRCDYARPHPFKEDTQLDDGTYLIGCPTLFYVVDDKQLVNPINDAGMKVLREQVAGWEYVQTRIMESGLTEEKPSKLKDDHCDSIKAILSLWGSPATDLTSVERLRKQMQKHLKDVDLNNFKPQHTGEEMAFHAAKMIAVEELAQEGFHIDKDGHDYVPDANDYTPPDMGFGW